MASSTRSQKKARVLSDAFTENESNQVIDALFLAAQHDHELAHYFFAFGSICKAARREEVLWRALVGCRTRT
jgi:hypothetical protein